MKLLLALCFSLFASAAMACTDFSGNYLNSEGVKTQITQSGCTSVTFTSAEGTGTMITDGQPRVTQDDAEIRVLTKAQFVGATLNLEAALEYKVAFPPEVPAQYIPRKAVVIYSKTSSGDVTAASSTYNSQNQLIYSATDSYTKIQ